MSSSHRHIPLCHAVIDQGRTPSPVMLPEIKPERFVDEFNRIYGRLGWTLKPVPTKVDVDAKSSDGEAPEDDPQSTRIE